MSTGIQGKVDSHQAWNKSQRSENELFSERRGAAGWVCLGLSVRSGFGRGPVWRNSAFLDQGGAAWGVQGWAGEERRQ